MAKPTNLGLWATTGAKTEPSTGVKAAGWAPNQRPPAQWFNWWMNAIYLWMVWLDAFESTTHTWTATQTWSGGAEIVAEDAIFTGEVDIFNLVGTDAAVFETTILVVGIATLTTLHVTGASTFDGNVQMSGVTSIDNLVVNGPTVFEGNVLFDGVNVNGSNGLWTLPQVDFTSGNNNSTVNAENTGGSGTGGAAGWFKNNDNLQPALVAEATSLSDVAIQAKGHIELQGNVPGSGIAVKDKITKLNIAKVVAKIQLNTTSAPNLLKELNITSVAQDSAGNVTINFAQDFDDADYVVSLLGSNTSVYAYEAITRLNGSCIITIFAYAGAQLDRASSGGINIDFSALGDQ